MKGKDPTIYTTSFGAQKDSANERYRVEDQYRLPEVKPGEEFPKREIEWPELVTDGFQGHIGSDSIQRNGEAGEDGARRRGSGEQRESRTNSGTAREGRISDLIRGDRRRTDQGDPPVRRSAHQVNEGEQDVIDAVQNLLTHLRNTAIDPVTRAQSAEDLLQQATDMWSGSGVTDPSPALLGLARALRAEIGMLSTQVENRARELSAMRRVVEAARANTYDRHAERVTQSGGLRDTRL